MIVVRRTGGAVEWQNGRDHWYHEELASVAKDCAPEPMSLASRPS